MLEDQGVSEKIELAEAAVLADAHAPPEMAIMPERYVRDRVRFRYFPPPPSPLLLPTTYLPYPPPSSTTYLTLP